MPMLCRQEDGLCCVVVVVRGGHLIAHELLVRSAESALVPPSVLLQLDLLGRDEKDVGGVGAEWQSRPLTQGDTSG